MARYSVAVAWRSSAPPSGTYDSLDEAKAAIRRYAAAATPPWSPDRLARLDRELERLDPRFPARLQGDPTSQEWIYVSPLNSRKRAGQR